MGKEENNTSVIMCVVRVQLFALVSVYVHNRANKKDIKGRNKRGENITPAQASYRQPIAMLAVRRHQ